MFMPPSCHATPRTIEDKPTMEPAWISIPPVIITKVTNREMIQIEIMSFKLPNSTLGIKNLGFFVANITISANKISSRTNSQLVKNFFAFSGKVVFILSDLLSALRYFLPYWFWPLKSHDGS